MILGSLADNFGTFGDFGAAAKKKKPASLGAQLTAVNAQITKYEKLTATAKKKGQTKLQAQYEAKVAELRTKAYSIGQSIAAGAAGKSAAAASTAKVSGAQRLQTALVLLGRIAGDSALAGLKINGVVASTTADATNRALTKHIGPGQAAAQYRTGKMPLSYIAANAGVLAPLIEAEVKRRGGTIVSPKVAIAGTAKYNASAKAAAAKAKKAALAKAKADKAAAKKAAALAKLQAKQQAQATAKAQAAAKKAAADAARARAAQLQTSSPAAAAAAAAQADALETEAQQAETAATKLDTGIAQDTREAQAAHEEEAAAGAEAETSAKEAAAGAAVAAVKSTTDEGGGEPGAGGGAPSGGGASESAGGGGGEEAAAPSGSSGGGLARYKWPLIAAGGVGVLSLAAILFMRKRPSRPGALVPARARR